MSRIRSVHPSQWTEEGFAQCSPVARLLLLGLRNESDDHGVFEWRPLSLKMRILPLDDVRVEELLAELVEHELIRPYECSGRRYGSCAGWDQQPQHPSYRYPLPPGDGPVENPADNSVKARVIVAEPSAMLSEPSATPPPELESESKSKSKRESSAGAPGGAALSLDDDLQDLPEGWRAEAAEGRRAARLPAVNLDAEWAKFRGPPGAADGAPRAGAPSPAALRRRWFGWAMNARAAPGAAIPEAAAAPAPAAAPKPIVHLLGEAGERLRAELGDAAFRAWCTGLVARIDGRRLDLVAPTGAVKAWLRQHESEILRAFRPCGVDRVEIALKVAGPGAAAGPGAVAAAAPAVAAKPRDRKTAAQQHLKLPIAGGKAANGAAGGAITPALPCPIDGEGEERAAG